MKICVTKSDIPKEAHFAIVEQVSVNIPGDERSRTNPGHGYPETTERYWRYYAFNDEKEWQQDIESRARKIFGGMDTFVAFKSNPATIKVEVKTSIGIEY